MPNISAKEDFLRCNQPPSLQNQRFGFVTTIKKKTECDCLAGNYMFKVGYRNTRARCETCSKLTIKTPERRQCSRSGFFIVNFEHTSHPLLVLLLLTLSR